jgi:methylthioribulose-1-phosphate dehydratase
VLHTHSVWSTVVSGWHAAQGGVAIEGFEMLKGLAGVQTHEHREWVSIIENSQYMAPLSRIVSEALRRHPEAHGFLLKEHGLYTWGATIDQAKRHVEIFEFLMETLVRKASSCHL